MGVQACICTLRTPRNTRSLEERFRQVREVIYNSLCDSEDRDEIRRSVSEARSRIASELRGARYFRDIAIDLDSRRVYCIFHSMLRANMMNT